MMMYVYIIEAGSATRGFRRYARFSAETVTPTTPYLRAIRSLLVPRKQS
ncbi:MAG: hypothetical protein HYY06_18840 [Deltaproteobacteria bacterium]|nr:hypothetical protein [Deltaproteobacteria bacterium]